MPAITETHRRIQCRDQWIMGNIGSMDIMDISMSLLLHVWFRKHQKRGKMDYKSQNTRKSDEIMSS